MRRPCVPWPDDARIAVNFYLVLEAWAGPQAQAGIRVTPDFPREATEAGQRDWATESWQNYGGQAGFYRLMDVLNEYGVKGSASIRALAVETWPDLVREFVPRGPRAGRPRLQPGDAAVSPGPRRGAREHPPLCGGVPEHPGRAPRGLG